jgi:hypothetical protein
LWHILRRTDDPALIPYRRSKTVAERAAWDFMDSDTIRTGSGPADPAAPDRTRAATRDRPIARLPGQALLL